MTPRTELGPGYTIPRVILGGWQHSEGHSSGPDPRETFRVWDWLLEHGFDTFDCADIYTGVESLIGSYVVDRRRRGALVPQVHTKLVPDRSALPTLRPDYLSRVVDRSLARLRIERLDLVQFHWWDYSVPGYLEALGWLGQFQRMGKIRLVGLTNFDTEHLRELLDVGVPLASIQVQYSVLDRRPERGLSELCRQRGLAILAYGTVAGGFLSDRWWGAPKPEEELGNRSLIKYRLVIEEIGGWELFQRLLGALATIAERRGASIANVATRLILDRPGVAAAIVGVRTLPHAQALQRLLEIELDDTDRAIVDRIVGPNPGPPGDVYQVERATGGAHASIMRYEANRIGSPASPS